jgi:hypothetical protein
MSKDINYTPGHSVHFIQARKALEALGQWRRVTIINVGEGDITLQIGDVAKNYICGDTTRLLEVLGTGRVPLNQQGEYFTIIAPHNVLIIPCADEGKVFPAAAGINSTVSYIEEGVALWSPTTDGAWHLFSVALEE